MKILADRFKDLEKNNYPCLKYFLNGAGWYIVLFAKERVGVCVYSEHRVIKVGDTAVPNGWNEVEFLPYDGKITLQN